MTRADENISTEAAGRIRDLMNNGETLKKWTKEQKMLIDLLKSEWRKYDGNGVIKEALDTIGKTYQEPYARQEYLKSGWLDENNAKIISEAIQHNKTDKKSNNELEKALKDIGKNGNSGSNSTTNNNTFNITDNGDKKFSLKSWEFELSLKSVKEISDELLKKPEKLVDVPEAEIKKQLEEMKTDWMLDTTIDEIIKAVRAKKKEWESASKQSRWG